MSFIPLYAFKFGLTVIFCRSFRKCPWRLTRLLYCPTWAIGIARDTLILCLYPLYGPLILFQLAHWRLHELPLCDHGIVGHGPDLVLEWMDTILLLCQRHHLPSRPCPSLTKLRTRSDPPAPQVFMQQGSRTRILTLLPSSFIFTLSASTSLSYFADASTSADRHLVGMLYFRAWAIYIRRSTFNLPLYLFYGLLTVLQLIHWHLRELLLGDHGIVGRRPDLVFKAMDTILIPHRRRCFPFFLRPSQSKLCLSSKSPARWIFVQQGSRPRILALLSLSFLSIPSSLTLLSYFADAFAISPGD